MPALAVTDGDGLYGAVKHAVACDQAGIAPILGADLTLRDSGRGRDGRAARRDGAAERWDGDGRRGGAVERGDGRTGRRDGAAERRVTALASGRRGWASLCRLVSAAHQGERGSPGVTPDLVAEHAEGLVILLGPASDAGQAIAARRPDLAAAALARWRERARAVIQVVDPPGP